jgi:serine/threonine protein kinase
MQRQIKWKKGGLIGEGSFARVYQAMNIETGELYAVKRYKFSEETKKVEKEFASMRREINLLR